MLPISRGWTRLSKVAGAQWYPAGMEQLPATGVALQVRWGRMRLDPPTKISMFRLPPRKHYVLGELDELIRLENKFSTADKSLRAFLGALYRRHSGTTPGTLKEEDIVATEFLDRLYATQKSTTVGSSDDAAEELEHQEMMKYNQQENERMAKLRETRLDRKMDETLEEIVLKKLKHQEEEELKTREALEVLQQTEEFCKIFIPPEEIMRSLETAYDHPVDYNFAIDAHGYVYPGFSTKPWEIAPEDRPRIDDPNQPKIGAISTKNVKKLAVGSSSS